MARVGQASAEVSPPARTSAPSPLGFLLLAGLSPSQLAQAQDIAQRQQVSLQATLLAEGFLSEQAYYQALAGRLGLPFCATAPAFSDLSATSGAIRMGVAALQGNAAAPRWLIAPPRAGRTPLPRHDVLASLIAPRHPDKGRMWLTSPTLFERWWLEAHGARCAQAAATSLYALDPTFSAAAPAEPRSQALEIGMGLTLLGLLGAASVLTPTQLGLCLSGLVTLLLATFGMLYLLASLVRLFAAAASCDRIVAPVPLLTDAHLPTYSVLIPLYQEERILPGLIRALQNLDYPRAKLDVQIVVEADDALTRTALAKLILPPWCHVRVAPPGQPRTKPRALQIALPFARGSLLTIYDAEDVPDPDQLRKAASAFATQPADVGCLQARLAIDNTDDGWLPAVFGVEYAALFDVVNPGLAQLGLPIPLGGTSNHFRLSALRRVGGWDAWNVTEDADLGLRLARFGVRVETLDSTTHEEAPITLAAWMGQRRRWLKGWMQTFVTHARQPRRVARELGLMPALCAGVMMLGGIVGPLLGPLFTLKMLVDAATGYVFAPQSPLQIVLSTWTCFVAACGGAALGLPVVLGCLRRNQVSRASGHAPHGWVALVLTWLLLPAYYGLMSVAGWLALKDLLKTPYHWHKTSHGLARSSRRRASRPSPRPITTVSN